MALMENSPYCIDITHQHAFIAFSMMIFFEHKVQIYLMVKLADQHHNHCLKPLNP